MMKRIMYVLGMVFALCCCSSNGDKASSDAINDNGSNVNYLYSYYDFRQENPGCDIYGFCSKEDFGRWSNGDTVIIDLMAAPMAEITARLDIDRVVTPDNIPFVFNVEVNGERVAHISTTGNNSVYVNVPKENLGADGSARLIVVFENAALPGKYNPENPDPRKLGFALSGITVYGYSLKK
ncbi:MAG: hypothetical protein UH850_11690 [Paludibacteraceae bacterium]|jgi:hypothetical protein|nr:hypothetical protein [Paludibacteraceae bacterium]MEE1063756.1 hypothetical protein [Paludibacteraceae bacterium]MEE1084376.1 hypothetical protein [Paludibacteraceae bacterium]